LRSVENKNLGIFLMFSAILLIVFLPKLDFWTTSQTKQFRGLFETFFYLFILDFLLLGHCGSQPMVYPYVTLSWVYTVLYFLFFTIAFIFIPFLEAYIIKNFGNYDAFFKKIKSYFSFFKK
jgi:quinol-cytochrome oxidoreductase complex cytochrome b subunit